MAVENVRLTTEFTTIHRRAFELEDPTVLNPNSANPLLDGEWLRLTQTTYKMGRGSGVAGAAEPSYMYFAERGRYDTQAIQKGPFLFLGEYEAETLIMDASGLSVGAALMVDDVTIGGNSKRALKLRTSTNYIVGRVTRLPANNNGFLRFRLVNG